MQTQRKPILTDIEWQLEFYKTFTNRQGQAIDMYWLTYAFDRGDGGQGGVGLSVPHGREDIARFVAHACNAGRLALLACPPGTEFLPHPEFEP